LEEKPGLTTCQQLR